MRIIGKTGVGTPQFKEIAVVECNGNGYRVNRTRVVFCGHYRGLEYIISTNISITLNILKPA